MPLVYILLIISIGILNYLIDVRMGSSTYTYISEIGIPSGCCKRAKLSGNEFLGKALPFQLTSIGLPLIFHNATSGITLIILSLLLFLWRARANAKQRESTGKNIAT